MNQGGVLAPQRLCQPVPCPPWLVAAHILCLLTVTESPGHSPPSPDIPHLPGKGMSSCHSISTQTQSRVNSAFTSKIYSLSGLVLGLSPSVGSLTQCTHSLGPLWQCNPPSMFTKREKQNNSPSRIPMQGFELHLVHIHEKHTEPPGSLLSAVHLLSPNRHLNFFQPPGLTSFLSLQTFKACQPFPVLGLQSPTRQTV